MRIFVLAALTGACLTASSAMATVIDFTGFTTDVSKSSETYGTASATVTVRPYIAANGRVGGSPALVEAVSPGASSSAVGPYRGLGMTMNDLSAPAIDRGDRLEFLLQPGYRVTSVTVTADGTNDSAFTLLVDNMVLGVSGVTADNTPTSDGRTTINVAMTTGSIFAIEADANDSNGLWVSAINIEATNTIPLPASSLLLGAGLLALRLRQRRS